MITICHDGHTGHYPPELETMASEQGLQLAFCTQCPCGTVALAIIWGGDRLRVMERGGMDLFADFEATGWPEFRFEDPNGIFFCREMPPLGYAAFAARRSGGQGWAQ